MSAEPRAARTVSPEPALTRVFFALWPDAATSRQLHDLAEVAHTACAGRKMRRESLHLTLAFIGEVSRERLAALLEAGSRIPPARFTLNLDRLGGWRHNRVVWAGTRCVPPALSELASHFASVLGDAGFPVERRSFSPHVTLIRKAQGPFAERPIDTVEWRVDGFVLVESERRTEGARYKILRKWSASNALPR